MSNPIRYTSRTFQTILNDINSDSELIDKPVWWKRIWSGVGDVISMYINATANQGFLDTAFTRQAVTDLCKLIDYELSGRSTSSGTLLFYLKGATIFPVAIAALDMAGKTEGSISVSSKKYEARVLENVAASSEVFTAAVTDLLTVARVYTTGEKVRVTTTNTLPVPLAINTDYYVIYVNATTIKLTTTLVDAYAGTNVVNITTTGVGVHTVHMYSFQKDCYQQDTLDSSTVIGVSDGSTTWQEFNLLNVGVLEDTVVITINSLPWTRVDTFVDSQSTDRHFRLIFKSDGSSSVVFGDGTYGLVPPAFDIFVDYSYGGGSDSNVSTPNKILIYAGSDANIEGVSNPSTFTGGGNEEDIESAKALAPLFLKARNRYVTTEDGEALAGAYPGVSRVKINKNVYGVLSAQVVIVPDGGGLPSGSLKTAVEDYLIALSMAEERDVRAIDPSYATQNVTSAMKMKTGFVYTSVLPYYTLAVRLLVSEVTNEIVSDYLSNGITSAVTYINTKWSTSFTIDDYAQIQNLIEGIYDRDMIPDFGQSYNVSDVLGYLDTYIFGCGHVTWTLPALPFTLGSTETATDGAMTLSEIV